MCVELVVLDLGGVILDSASIAMPHSPPHVRAAASRVAPPAESGGLAALLAELCPTHFGS